MEIIKRKILLENYIDRKDESQTYGEITASTFYVNIMITQNIDDMGMFTDVPYEVFDKNNPPNYDILIQKLERLEEAAGIANDENPDQTELTGYTSFPFVSGIAPTERLTGVSETVRVTGTKESDYYNNLDILVFGLCESRLDDLKSYDKNDVYKLNFDVSSETYINYSGGTVNGISRIISFGDPLTYVIDADKNDANIGVIGQQKDGLLFQEYNDDTKIISYIGQGLNQTNVSLSAITKEEYLFGLIYAPEIENDVFIDRGITVVYDTHLRMSEITNMDQLERYNNGYFNIIVN